MPICKRCGREVERVSRRGICLDCGIGAVLEAATQMRNKSGPIYEKQQSRLKAARELMKGQE